jgi:very-short-patch-repair endonuclease
VADSALRDAALSTDELPAGLTRLRGPGSAAARRVGRHADGRAANPFESVLRALCIEDGFDLTPQLVVAEPGLWARVDLGSESLRLAVEADGSEHHGTRRSLRQDCRRHTEFAALGWSSLRFAHEDVMPEQDWTRWVLRTWRITQAGGVPESPPARTDNRAG